MPIVRLVPPALVFSLISLVGCSHMPCPDVPDHQTPSAARDPFEVIAGADAAVTNGRHDQALRDYLWALDQKVEGDRSSSFEVTLLNHVLDAMVALGEKYPPAKVALLERFERLTRRITWTAENGRRLDVDADLFVRMGTVIGQEASVLRTWAIVRNHLPSDAKLRYEYQDLWMTIEKHLVQERRYDEAAAEHEVSLAFVRFVNGVFRQVGPNDEMKHSTVADAIEIHVKRSCGVHFEALVGSGQSATADAFAEEVVQFRPTAHTFAVLIKSARRAGAPDVANRLRTRAHDVVREADRAIVDKALSEGMTD